MYITITGAGVLGFYTAKFLSERGHDVIVIEQKKDRADSVADKIDATVICGDAKEIKTLQEAGIEHCDVVLAMTGNDDSNILISILSKQLGAKRALCRITHIEYSEDLFKKLGIDAVIYPELSIATQIEEMVGDQDIIGFAMLDDGNIEMVEFVAKQGSKMIGKKISSISFPKNSRVISIIRKDGQMQEAEPENVISIGDKLLVLTSKTELQKVEKELLK